MTNNGAPTHLNNFDFMRLTAALMVLVQHQFDLMHQTVSSPFPIGYGELGVAIFFTISGFLVVQSWIADPHIIRFMEKRFLRIWPGLLVATCLAALVLGPTITTLGWQEYFSSELTLRYFRNLRLDIQYLLPGVFAANPYPNAVNGSLWTIPLEVKWYGLLLIGGVLRLFKYRWIILSLTILVAVYQFGIYHAETNPEPNYTRQFGLYFLYGICMYLLMNFWEQNFIKGVIITSIISGLFLMAGHSAIALWTLLPFVVISLGSKSVPVINRFGRFGDLSYGIYIYAFPMQQLMIWINRGRYSLTVCLIGTIVSTLLFAFVSWHLVEKQALKLKPKR